MKFFEGNELILRFMLINISSGIAVGMMNFIIPIYALSLKANSTEIGLITGISGIGDLLIVLPAGLLVDYFGSKKVYSASCMLGATIIMLLSFVTVPALLLPVMVFYGMARAFRITSQNAAFFKNLNIIGTRRAGWYNGSMTIGVALIGPLIGGLAAIATGFTSYFVFTGMFLLIPLIVIFAYTNHRNNLQVKPGNSSIIGASNHYKYLSKNRILMFATMIGGLNTALFIAFTTFITVFVIRDLGLSPGIAAMLISIKGGATLVVFFCGHLLRRNKNNLYLFSFILTILSLLILVISKDTFHLAIASAVQGIGSGLISLINITQVGNIEGEKGKIAGIFSFGNGIGAIFGPTLGGIIGDAFGLKAIFLAFMLPFGVVAFYTYLIERQN